MKRWISFTLLLVISFIPKGQACSFYPEYKDLFFCVFKPENFRYEQFKRYHYNYNPTYNNPIESVNSVSQNDLMWQKHCNYKVSLAEIKKAIFQISIDQCNRSSKNLFIQYLYKSKDFETIEYIKFAKEVEKITNVDSNIYWEKADFGLNRRYEIKIKIAQKRIECVIDPMLKKRYYYQIFKLLDYTKNSNKRTINLYNKYVSQYHTTDFIDNWALYYRMNAEDNDVKRNFLVAQVLVRGTDNKFDIKWHFKSNVPIHKVLKFAKSNRERANVYVLYSFRNLDPSLNNIKKIIELDPANVGLSFLLLREINKIEHWVLTPTYTMFFPELEESRKKVNNSARQLKKVEMDRQYAKKLFSVVHSLNLKKVENKEFCLLAKSYLAFLAKDYKSAIRVISSVEKNSIDKKIKHQLDIIKALVLTANQKENHAVVLEQIKPVVLRESKKENFLFLFAIAKELEFLNNKVEAGYLISKIKDTDYGGFSSIPWKSKTGKITLQEDYYNDWYGYIDAELTTNELQKIVNEINIISSPFDRWKKKTLKNNLNKVYDLLGIKYVRDNNLPEAYNYFSKMNKSHYTNLLFNENPFYKIKGNADFDPKQKAKNLTKAKVIFQLMEYLKKAEDVNNSKRDIYYFLAANCYYNMGYYGNSWMLKRINWTSTFWEEKLQDEKEYYSCLRAKELYSKALKYAKEPKFRVLCSYMITYCQVVANQYEYIKVKGNIYDENTENLILKPLQSFKKKYKKDYEQMTSNCEVFSNYYKKRLRRM